MVEHVGSGFKRIQDSLQEYGLGNITLDVNVFWFSVTFRRTGIASETIYETGGKPDSKSGARLGNELGDHEREIMRLIFDNSRISTTMIAESINLSSTSVGNIIKKLKDKGILERMGTARSGYWKIVRPSTKRFDNIQS